MALTIIGNALSFDGSTQWAGRAIVSTATDNFSISMWINVTSYPSAGVNDTFYGNGEADANGVRMQIDDAGVFNFDFAFVANLSSGYTLNTGTWYHVAAVRTSGTTQLYVNGAAQGGTSASTPNGPASYVTVGANRIAGGTAGDWFNGVIDEIRHYDRAITAAEVLQVYNRGTNTRDYADISAVSIRDHWKMDEVDGTNCADTASGGPLTTTGSPTFVAGKVEIKRETKIPSRPRPAAFSPGLGR